MANNSSKETGIPAPGALAPPQAGESQWILHALTQMQANMDKLDQRTRRIEKMLWTIIGAASLVTLLFGNEILAFFRGLLANN